MLLVLVLLVVLITVVQAMTKTVLGAQLRSRQRLRCGAGGAFPGGPAPAWARFPFLATSAAKMGMLLPFMAIFCPEFGTFHPSLSILQQTWGCFCLFVPFPPQLRVSCAL